MNEITVHQNIPAMTTWIDQALATYRDAIKPIPNGDPRLTNISDTLRHEIELHADEITRAELYWEYHVAMQLPHPPLARPCWAAEAELTAAACDDGHVMIEYRRDAEFGAATVIIDQHFTISLVSGQVEEHPIGILVRVTDNAGRTTGVELDREALPLVMAGLQKVESVIGADS